MYWCVVFVTEYICDINMNYDTLIHHIQYFHASDCTEKCRILYKCVNYVNYVLIQLSMDFCCKYFPRTGLYL